MERSINRVELRGNVGQDPKVTTVGERKVARFTLATNEVFKDKNGVFREETTWHNVSAWSGKGIADLETIKKGSCVALVGRIRNNRYTSADGEEKSFFEIAASKLSVEENNN